MSFNVVLILFSLLQPQCVLQAAAVSADFTGYPPASQQCILTAAKQSGCPLEAETGFIINDCLCSNSSFVPDTASCLYSSDRTDLQAVWDTMLSNCESSDTPVQYSEGLFLNGGVSVQLTTSLTPSLSALPATSPTAPDVTSGASTTLITAPENQAFTPASPTAPSTTAAVPSPATSSASSSSSGNASDSPPSIPSGGVGKLSAGAIAAIAAFAGLIVAVVAVLGLVTGCKTKRSTIARSGSERTDRTRPARRMYWAVVGGLRSSI